MFSWLFWVLLIVAVADWVAAWRGWKSARWVTKPAALLLLIAWFTQMGGWQGGLVWFGVGLVFSLLGDIMLQAPERYFLFGVGAFFLAHVAYIVGLFEPGFGLDAGMLVPLVIVGAAFWYLSGRIRRGLAVSGDSKLEIPVTAYAGVLSLMLLVALTTLFNPEWQGQAALLVSLGAALFFLSDSVLAWNRFVRPISAGNLIVMVTYHLGQILIIAGALTRFAA
jgi:uncharacterized membrane protein YhhN